MDEYEKLEEELARYYEQYIGLEAEIHATPSSTVSK